MLNAAIGAVVGVLGIAVAADWLSWQRRTIKLLMVQADLASALPLGEARSALEARLETDVDQYMHALDRRRRRKGAVLILVMTVVGFLLAAGGVVANLVVGVDDSWATAVTWVGLTIEIVGVVLMRRLDNQLESQMDLPATASSHALMHGARPDEPTSDTGIPHAARRGEPADRAIRHE